MPRMGEVVDIKELLPLQHVSILSPVLIEWW
jgi:hypothetical protein